ncbi:hypothetical protein HYV81_04960 [Candidatus Woesearchaeota archaeon]|nr:hypothetical protein [Candidatus Woesearchaeota archaeon]
MKQAEDHRHQTSLYYRMLDIAGHYANMWHNYWVSRNQAKADELYVGRGQYILLEEARRIFGQHLPEQPYNGEPMEIRFGRYVHPETWKLPIHDIKESIAAGKRVLEVHKEQWGSYTLDMFWKLKHICSRAQEEGLDILLAQFEDIRLVEPQPR